MLELLLYGHRHKWSIIKDEPIRLGDHTDIAARATYAVQCDVCGRIRSYRAA